MKDSSKIFDGLLVLEYCSGNKKAMNVLVKKYHKKLCRHSYSYTYDIDASKDIVQDSWSIIIRKLDSLKNPNQFGSWAFRIVTRKSLDFVTAKRKEIYNLRNYNHEQKLSNTEDHVVDDLQKLRIAIRCLNQNHQIVLRLFYIENYSIIEIGGILKISTGTVKSRIFHARNKLKKIINKE